VPTGDPTKLAAAIEAALQAAASESAAGLRRCARQRVMEHFPLNAMVAQYEALWAELAKAQDA
jgi:glycosyltransferase involved in cell wall biosynthesis